MMIPIIGLASGLGAGDSRCALGPQSVRDHLALEGEWKTLILPQTEGDDKYSLIAEASTSFAREACALMKNHPYLLSIGGDHSCAVGTWSGVSEALHGQGEELGLIWVDAHLDCHTPETSDSGNIHGMPVAALLGCGDPRLTQILSERPKLKPENVFFVGIRSYEPAERAFCEARGMRIYYIEEVQERGLATVLEEIVSHFRARGLKYGMSVDVDAFDPLEAPGTGTPVEGGLSSEEFIAFCKTLSETPPVAYELVEFNPLKDPDGRTLNVVEALLTSALALKGAACAL